MKNNQLITMKAKHVSPIATFPPVSRYFKVEVSYPQGGGSHYLKICAEYESEARDCAISESLAHDKRKLPGVVRSREIRWTEATLGPCLEYWK